MIIKFKLITYLAFLILFNSQSISEPFIVLEYRDPNGNGKIMSSSNPFLNDFNYSVKHNVKKNETLSDIILNYYGSNNLNKDMLSLSIVHFNKHAFVRRNPNYLFANKKLYLPSINEIKSMILKNNSRSEKTNTKIDKHIYFFGG